MQFFFVPSMPCWKEQASKGEGSDSLPLFRKIGCKIDDLLCGLTIVKGITLNLTLLSQKSEASWVHFSKAPYTKRSFGLNIGYQQLVYARKHYLHDMHAPNFLRK